MATDHIYKYIEECQLPKYFTTDRLREVARQCLQTLAVLHAREVIHCDLKPENILISSLTACAVKVIDYGNAYLHHDQRCSYVQSRAYRAPEVVLGHPYSPKVDLWSLGCILMELLTNRAHATQPMRTRFSCAGCADACAQGCFLTTDPSSPSLLRTLRCSGRCRSAC